jgi:uncharacterized Zn-finger protein
MHMAPEVQVECVSCSAVFEVAVEDLDECLICPVCGTYFELEN